MNLVHAGLCGVLPDGLREYPPHLLTFHRCHRTPLRLGLWLVNYELDYRADVCLLNSLLLGVPLLLLLLLRLKSPDCLRTTVARNHHCDSQYCFCLFKHTGSPVSRFSLVQRRYPPPYTDVPSSEQQAIYNNNLIGAILNYAIFFPVNLACCLFKARTVIKGNPDRLGA
jgi:hypothetical protein